jgi:hypothetical protein
MSKTLCGALKAFNPPFKAHVSDSVAYSRTYIDWLSVTLHSRVCLVVGDDVGERGVIHSMHEIVGISFVQHILLINSYLATPEYRLFFFFFRKLTVLQLRDTAESNLEN